ncbi:ATP-binding protein [Desulfovibrio aminophilus]|uniref:ATP-binding protein n=1 Tax=Desulfovibrio aminophilus TaxID=81425 RepID=UPI003395B251
MLPCLNCRDSILAKLTAFVLGLFILVPMVLGCERQDRRPPRAEAGLLDLRGWDFEKDGVVPLNGQWEFLWGSAGPSDHRGPLNPGEPADHYSVPSLWGGPTALGRAVSPHGLAAYRLRLRLAPGAEANAMHLAGPLSVCQIWVDGRLVGSNGDIDADAGRETPRTHLIMPDLGLLGPESQILLVVSNHTNVQGGLNTPIFLGSLEQISRMTGARWMTGALIAGILLAMGGYHLVVFAMRRSDKSNLYFGLFALAWSVATLFSPVSGFVMSALTQLPWRLHIDLALLPYGFTIPLMVVLYHSLFPKRFGRQINALYILLGGAYVVFLLASEPSAFGRAPILYYMATRTAFLYIFAAFATDILHRERGVLLLAPGYLALAWAELSKMLFDLHLAPSAGFTPYGMPAFILSHSLFMSVRFSQTFLKVERLSGELETTNERLLRLNRLKDEFLANATHELKTPLAGMVGISDSLLAGAGGGMSEAARGHLRMLSHSGKRLSRLVDDVLEHARLEHMDVKLTLEPVRLEAAVRRVLTLTRGLATDKGLELRDCLPQNLPPVLADPGRLEQILFNLVGNGIKYTEHGWVELSARVLGQRLEVSVADSGAGIAPGDRERIFESYSQLAADDSGGTGGAGLGLAIARRLVELHGGELTVASGPAQGSVFNFTLPFCPATEAALPPASDRREEADPPTGLDDGPSPLGVTGPDYQVLIVDDEPVNLHVVATCLALAEITFKTARGGAEALALLGAGDQPGMVLLDVMMPGQDGYAVCREIRRSRGAASLPVVMLTCRGRVEDVLEGFAAGANDYVTKPFSREELVARVGTQLELQRAHRVLEENADLRREVAMRRKTEQDLRLRQIRLSRMLDAVGEAVFALNQSREIAFCNQAFESLTGKRALDILGQPLARLLAAPDSPAARRLTEALDRLLDGGEAAVSFEAVDIASDGDAARSCRVHAARLDLEEESLLLLSLGSTGADGDGRGLADSAAMLRRLEGNRLRLQRIAETLSATEADGAQAAVLEDLNAVDALLESIHDRLSGGSEPDARLLAVRVMRAALDCWTEGTGLGKGELAAQSGLWNSYMERDGYLRTQTLDKYLSPESLPQKPRWRSVAATAEFVLSACPNSGRRDELRRALDRLRPLHP